MGNKLKDKFKDKTAEQIFSFCLLISCIITMLFCAIVRLCGGLWFQADLSKVQVPNQWWQDRIMNLLFIFELVFVYKILCRTNWLWCMLIAIIQTIIIHYIPTNSIATIVNFVLIIIIPICFQRDWHTLLDSTFIYTINSLYGLCFLVGRINGSPEFLQCDFIASIIGSIDYKLFIVSIYLYIKNFGGVKLWKNQKRLICQRDLKKKEM